MRANKYYMKISFILHDVGGCCAVYVWMTYRITSNKEKRLQKYRHC